MKEKREKVGQQDEANGMWLPHMDLNALDVEWAELSLM